MNNLLEDSESRNTELQYLQKCDYLMAGSFLTNPNLLINNEIRIANQLNALYTAVTLQRLYHITKQLPEQVPPEIPKDLFSDKPFLIIKTPDGLTLKCQGEDLYQNELHQYEFKLPKD